jgi:uncharacterized protein
MRRWRERLALLGEVDTFDYPYRLAGRRFPDRLPVLVAAHRAALAAAMAHHPGRPAYLAGKSMGGRIGCHVALQDAVNGVICLGYPLRGGSGALREDVLLALRTRVLFVQGTRDSLCPIPDLACVRSRMSAPNELHVVEAANHSLEVPVRELRSRDLTQAEVDAAIASAIERFVTVPG